MSRFPIRVRLTAAFAVAMALVLALVFLFLYLRLQSGLDSTIDNGLRSRSDDVAALVAQADSGLAQGGGSTRLSESAESFAQVLTRAGGVFDSTPGAAHPALTRAEVRQISSSTIFDDRQVAGIEGPARLLATPVSAQGARLVLIVGTSTGERDEALDGLLDAFLVGGPIAILLSSGLGYLLASAGLAPVEALRRRAEVVTLKRGGERLPLPDAKDEIRRLGETLNAMLARLEESFARERAFVADASHELRTPLAVLKAELEVTLRGEGYDAETGAALHSAAEEVENLARLAEDLLVIARADEGALALQLEPTDIRDLLETVVGRADQVPDAQRPRVEVEAPSELEVPLDRLRIGQALGNLIENARRHGAAPIRVEARTAGGQLELSVTDGGAGFPDEFIAEAFDRFTRADQSRARGGAGLGLAIVRAIAGAHGGTVTIERVASGSRVCLLLPLSHPCHRAALASPRS